MTLRSTLLSTTIVVVAGTLPAGAAPNGWYASLEGGAAWVQSLNGHETNNGIAIFGEEISVDTGWMVAATAGFEWGQWRFEGEAAYRHNKMDEIAFTTGFVSTDVDDLSQLTLMANALYDIPLRSNLSLSVGAGVGADRLTFKWPGFGQPGGVEGEDWSIAYQGIVGLNYAFDNTYEAFANYRFLAAQSLEFTDRANEQHLGNVDSHTLSAGLRYRFGS